MQIYFGENLKRLRKARELTQEALADCLGVSFQTVSKWERGETYPDVTALPTIADLFGVTVDELLGADRSKREEKIGYYLALYDNMTLKNVSAVFREYRKAVKEFPNEYAILVRYMELLQTEQKYPDVEEYSVQTAKICERIRKHCTDDAIRIRSKRLMLKNLMRQYCTLGYDEAYRRQAERIIETLPALEDARELAASDWATAENRYETVAAEIEELTYLLQNAVIGWCYYQGPFTAEYRIGAIEHMNGVIKLLDADGRPTKNRLHLIYNYGHLGHLYAETGDDAAALRYLRLAAEQAVLYDGLPEAERTAIFYEREERYREMNARERLRELMTEHYPLSDEFRKMPEFRKIVEGLVDKSNEKRKVKSEE